MPEIAVKLPPPPQLPDCTPIPQQAADMRVRLPFNLEIKAIPPSMGRWAGPDEQVMQFLAALQPAMSPIMSVLTIAGVAKTLIDCIKAIPAAIALSPGDLLDCIVKLNQQIPKLFQLVPPFTYIAPTVDITLVVIELILRALDGVAIVLDMQAAAQAFAASVELNPQLGQFQGCVDGGVTARKEALALALRAVAPFFDMLALLLGLLDLPGISGSVAKLKNVTTILGDVTAGAVDASLSATLQDVKDTLLEVKRVVQTLG